MRINQLLWIVLFTWVGSTSSLAEDSFKQGQCFEEVKKICTDLTAKGSLKKCLKEHKNEFSPECQAKAAQKRKEMKQAYRDCKRDVKMYCDGVKRGQGRVIACLKENTKKLSPVCKSHVADRAKSK